MDNSNSCPRNSLGFHLTAEYYKEAADPSVPLIERIRFLGIYSNNQDEFFKVRVAELKRQSIINNANGKGDDAVNLLRRSWKKMLLNIR